MSDKQGQYAVIPGQEQNQYPQKPAEQMDQNIGQGVPVPPAGIQTHTNSFASAQPHPLIMINANPQNLRKCDWPGCNYASFSRCDYKWCCMKGCGKSFCLDHKAHMIRIGKNQDYSTAVCKDCESPFWNAVVKCKVASWLCLFIMVFAIIALDLWVPDDY